MRTYDKLIATIQARQGTAGLRTCIGVARYAGSPRAALRTRAQAIG
jgi:hypothetical protein